MSQHEEFFDALLGTKDNLQLRARAGTGKTYAIIYGAKQLGEHSPSARQSIVAFNKPIAEEAQAKLDEEDVKAKAVTTHAMGNSILSLHRGHRVDIDNKQQQLRKEVKELVSGDDVSATLKVLGRLKNNLYDPEMVDKEIVNTAAAQAGCVPENADYVTSACRKLLAKALDYKRAKYVTFDDMLYAPAFLGLQPARPPDVLYIDEAQDLNPAQHGMMLHCFEGARTIVVGDERQAIYQFRGAHEDSLNEMKAIFRAHVMPLNVSRRCPVSVTAVASKIVPDFRHMPDAPQGAVRTVDELEWMPNSLVLCRRNAPMLGACLDIIAKGKPAHIQGRDFSSNVLSFLKRVVKFGRVRELSQLGAACIRLSDSELKKATAKFDNTKDIAAYMMPLEDQIECLMEMAKFCETITELQELCVDLFKRGDGMKFSTVHRAKGLEADTVYVIEPETMPLLPRNREDGAYGVGAYSTAEQNVAYVAFTRSRNELLFVGDQPSILN